MKERDSIEITPHLGEFEQVLEEHSQRIYFEGKKLVKYTNKKNTSKR